MVFSHYSQAAESKYSIPESFGKMLDAEFNAGSSVVKVNYRACSREEHHNDSFYYHCALKLKGCKKWLSVKNRLAEEHGIQASFSDKPNFYMSTYRYVCKSDQEVYHSENNPPGLLKAAFLQTKKSISRLHAACVTKMKYVEEEPLCGVGKKRKSLTNLDLAEFIQGKGSSEATLLSLLLLWSGKLLARWRMLNSYSNELRNPWTCYQNLANGVSQRKTRSQQSISNRYSKDTFNFWLCWRLLWSVVSGQGRSSAQ